MQHFIASLVLRFKSVIKPVHKVLLFTAYANSPFIHACAAIKCGSRGGPDPTPPTSGKSQMAIGFLRNSGMDTS